MTKRINETGPTQSQANYFYRLIKNRYPYPIQHFVGETERLYGVLDTRLEDRNYVAGPGRGKYSIADIAIWSAADCLAVCGIELEKFPNVYKWWERIGERDAVKKGTLVPSGEPWGFAYKTLSEKREEEGEKALKRVLEEAQKEFGYVYSSP